MTPAIPLFQTGHLTPEDCLQDRSSTDKSAPQKDLSGPQTASRDVPQTPPPSNEPRPMQRPVDEEDRCDSPTNIAFQ